MLKTFFWLCLAITLLCQTAEAKMADKGVIIRVVEGLVYIDQGQRDGVMEGDLFDIISHEVLSHPLTGDTLAVTPKSVGALRVRQVLPKMSIAQVMQLNSGFDPMLMEIARVQTPERLMEIEMLAKRTMFASMGISRRMAFIPGLYQMKMGDERKGWTLLALDGAALAAGIGYRMNSNDWKDRYDRLPAGTAQSDFDFYFNEANDRRKRGNRFLWLAGALYAYNWVDALWMGNGGMSYKKSQQPMINLGLGFGREGNAMLQLSSRF